MPAGPLISEDLLSKTDKILFLTHLAIGDFSYMQNYLKAFSERYPHIKIDLWVDEVRRTWFFWKWDSLKKYSLYDWVGSINYFNKIYTKTYSPFVFRSSLKQAQEEHYPVIVSLCTLRSSMYARYARCISPKGIIVGVVNSQEESSDNFNGIVTKPHDKELTKNWHITDYYAYYFERLFGFYLRQEERFPFIEMSQSWEKYAENIFKEFGILENEKVVFINSFAKTPKRSWPLRNVDELISNLKKIELFKNMHFIVSTLPEEFSFVNNYFSKQRIDKIHVFSAKNNFFELPALIKKSNFVISVETAIMHLACALRIPVVALMRTKTPEWVPYDRKNSEVVFAKGRGWVKSIPVEDVVNASITFFSKYESCTLDQSKMGNLPERGMINL